MKEKRRKGSSEKKKAEGEGSEVKNRCASRTDGIKRSNRYILGVVDLREIRRY